MDREEWRDITGYEGLYQVSNTGKIKAIKREHVSGKLLKAPVSKRGYRVVTLYRPDGTRKKFYVHRIVATAFIPNGKNLPCIDHIDTDRTNNSVENLSWCTYFGNRHNDITFLKQRKSVAKHFVVDRLALDIAIENGVTKTAFYARIRNGWLIDRACKK